MQTLTPDYDARRKMMLLERLLNGLLEWMMSTPLCYVVVGYFAFADHFIPERK